MILYINACARKVSRTKRLADCLLKRFTDSVKEVRLYETALPKTDDAFISWRIEQSAKGDFSSPVFDLAQDFAKADTIVIAAPYWDLSFPAILKQYLEHVCVIGLTFCYDDDLPKGMCRAKKLYYVTTAGGNIANDEYGFGYVKALCHNFFGIDDCQLIKAENLDKVGVDAGQILKDAMAVIESLKLD